MLTFFPLQGAIVSHALNSKCDNTRSTALLIQPYEEELTAKKHYHDAIESTVRKETLTSAYLAHLMEHAV